MKHDNYAKFLPLLAYVHAAFYLINGLWPLVDLESFMMVTGLKNDYWLVRTVGVLVTGTGIVILHAAIRREITSSIALLAVANALGLTAIDAFYVSHEILSPVYLLDAFAEMILVFAWLYLWPNEPRAVST